MLILYHFYLKIKQLNIEKFLISDPMKKVLKSHFILYSKFFKLLHLFIYINTKLNNF
jgi:hypothetical protein